MIKTINEFRTEWDNVDKIKLFEIAVFNEITQKNDFLVYKVRLKTIDNILYFVSRSIDGVEPVKSEIDLYFSLDENLQTFYEECITDILEADDYNLR